MAVLTSSTLELYCWTGRFDNQPTSPQYTITKTNPDLNNTVRFEIAELVQDYIEIVFDNNYGVASSGLSNIKSTCWWSYDKTNIYSDATPTTIDTAYGVATKGYGYFEDGINSNNVSSKLISNQYIYIPEGQAVRVPVYKGPNGVSIVRFYSKDSAGNEFIADRDTEATFSQLPSTEDCNRFIKYASTNVVVSKIEIVSQNTSSPTYSATTGESIETVYPIYLDCSKFNNYKISFINKFGAIQDLWFNKKRTDNLSLKRETFNTSTIYSTASDVNYNTYSPTSIVQDVTSRKSLTLNTGFLKEEYNETIRQLMQSEDVWIRDNNTTLPVSIKDSSFDYKTHLNDKLVNYTVQFEFAFDGINTVR